MRQPVRPSQPGKARPILLFERHRPKPQLLLQQARHLSRFSVTTCRLFAVNNGITGEDLKTSTAGGDQGQRTNKGTE